MSKLQFNVRMATMSKLILTLANPAILAVNLPKGVNAADIAEAVEQITREIDRRIPLTITVDLTK